MFVVPFFFRESLPSLIEWQIQPLTLFLENRGKQVCSAEDIEDWLVTNGFVWKRKWVVGKTCFVEIDLEKMDLADFYSFEQLTKQQSRGTEECWRTFFLLRAKPEEASSEHSWNETYEEPIASTLQELKKSYFTKR